LFRGNSAILQNIIRVNDIYNYHIIKNNLKYGYNKLNSTYNFFVFCILILYMQILDIISTFYGLYFYNFLERNIIMNYFLNNYGFINVALFKLLVCIPCFFLIWIGKKTRLFYIYISFILLFAVVVNNIINLWGVML